MMMHKEKNVPVTCTDDTKLEKVTIEKRLFVLIPEDHKPPM